MNTTIPSMQDLLSAGVHFGHQVRRGHPKMSQYVFGARDGVHIIDLAKTVEKLKEVTQAAFELGKANKLMLLVGTKKQSQEIIKNLAQQAQTPYLTYKWLGGLLTNFEEVYKNIKKLNTLKEQQQKGELAHYTKKEQLLISRKLIKFEAEVGGIALMENLPDALFLVDAHQLQTAVREAKKMGVLIFGICDTNSDPNWFDYPVPANDDGIKSIKMICETVIGAYIEGKKNAEKVKNEALKLKEKQEKMAEEALAEPVAEEAAALEEEIEKEVLAESERKVT